MMPTSFCFVFSNDGNFEVLSNDDISVDLLFDKEVSIRITQQWDDDETEVSSDNSNCLYSNQ